MSTDFSIKPVGAPVAAPFPPPASEAARSAITTELPASQSVTAADATARVRNDVGTASSFVSHQVVIDRDADAIVYQVVDNRTKLVVQQFPDQGSLRRRAYIRAQDLAKSGPTRPLVTDRKA
jgi:hypothetical protein